MFFGWACPTTLPVTDAGTVDSGRALVDAGTPVDAGSLEDSGVPLDGGMICGVLADAGVNLGDACGSCVGASCCEQVQGCVETGKPGDGGLSPCARFMACAGLCFADGGSPATCETGCAKSNLSGFVAASTVLKCVSDACSGSCSF